MASVSSKLLLLEEKEEGELVLAVPVAATTMKSTRRHRWWVHPVLSKTKETRSIPPSFRESALDADSFHCYFRLTREEYAQILYSLTLDVSAKLKVCAHDRSMERKLFFTHRYTHTCTHTHTRTDTWRQGLLNVVSFRRKSRIALALNYVNCNQILPSMQPRNCTLFVYSAYTIVSPSNRRRGNFIIIPITLSFFPWCTTVSFRDKL